MNQSKKPKTNQIDLERKYKLGTRFINSHGIIYRYRKIDFGICGKTKKGKVIRRVEYRWFLVRI